LIHSTAIISESAIINDDVIVGPYAIIGDNVEIRRGTEIGPHVVIRGPTMIGENNRIYQFSSIGDDPQDKKYTGEAESGLFIGNNNIIREYCSINRGTSKGGGRTVIGDNNWIMAYVHIAHDCIVGDHTVFANNATLAGHVTVENHATLGGFTGVHQFCRIGSHSFSAISSVITKDVPPYIMVAGNTAKPYGLNREGLRRSGLGGNVIVQLRKAYNILYREGRMFEQALAELDHQAKSCSEVMYFLKFLKETKRGIVR
jgi:UDP-N-acetylglucosamine acyltransferase